MTNDCIDVPISWLRLERYHLGEVANEEHAVIEDHVRACPACAECLGRLEEKRELPPLKIFPITKTKKAISARVVTMVSVITPLAAAALAFLWFHPFSKTTEVDSHPRAIGSHVKGGDVAFALVRDDDELLSGAAGTYHDGDRFRAIVTCPSSLDASWDVAVFEHGSPSFPLESTSHLACGNAVSLEGAFRLTGSEAMTICLVWDENGAIDRSHLVREDALGDQFICKHLAPAP